MSNRLVSSLSSSAVGKSSIMSSCIVLPVVHKYLSTMCLVSVIVLLSFVVAVSSIACMCWSLFAVACSVSVIVSVIVSFLRLNGWL